MSNKVDTTPKLAAELKRQLAEARLSAGRFSPLEQVERELRRRKKLRSPKRAPS